VKETFKDFCLKCPKYKDKCDISGCGESCGERVYIYQQQKIDDLEDRFGSAMLEIKSSIQPKIDTLRKIETLENQLTLANDKIYRSIGLLNKTIFDLNSLNMTYQEKIHFVNGWIKDTIKTLKE